MKDLKSRLLTEGNHRFYAEDYTNCQDANDVIEALTDALYWSGVYNSLAESVSNSLDPHIFTDEDFLKEFGSKLSETINEIYEEEYD